jgi:hypothetical protein
MNSHAAVDRASLTNFDVRASSPRKSAHPQQKAAHEKLKQAVPSAAVDFDPLLNTPKWVHATGGFLTGENGEGKSISAETAKKFDRDPDKALKAFLQDQRDLFRHGPEVLSGAKKTREHETKFLRTVAWEQQVDGIPVMDSILVAHTTARGELVSISSLFVPEPAAAAEKGTPNHAAKVRKPGVSAEQALGIAAENLGEVIEEMVPVDAQPAAQARKQKFNIKPLPGEATARLVWLPLDGETLRLGWDVEVTRREQGERFRLVIDAETGTILLRRKLTVEVSDVLYRVYTSDSPSPFSPGLSTITNIQPPLVPRQLLSISNVSAAASPLGWINDGVIETRGNNVDAHLDRDGDDRADLPRVQGTTNEFGQRSFDFPLDLTQHPTNYSRAAVAQLFYWCNWMHDRLYDLGFTESAGNFQKDNFGRGGMDNDVMLAQAQDGSGFNNANFTPGSDGSPGKVQMYIFNMASPFRDGDLDAEVILHEYAHGLTDRMVGGGVGIFQLQTAGMGEGWSDFYAEAMLSEFGDEPDAYYPMGGYVTYLFNGLTANYYYGIRRYPYTTNLNANPLTFKDIDPVRASAHPGIPRNPIITSSGPEVHRQGEVWCSMLWDMRAFLLRKYVPTNAVDFTNANNRILRYVTEGLRLSPPNPSFVQAREAILQAVRSLQGGSDTNEVWRAFARRGLGLSAIGPDSSTTVGVFEAFDTPMQPEFDVQPRGPITFIGLQGGPFVGSVANYTVANTSSSNVAWAAGENLPWLQLSTVGGVLASGASVDCVVSLAPLANTLPVGIYSGTVFFTNLTRTQVLARAVSLTIQQSNAPPVDALAVSPLNQLSLEGSPGGPFRLAGGTGAPERIEHLANVGNVTVSWNAFTTNSWLSITPPKGFIDPSEVQDVLISLNPAVNQFLEGIYAGGVTFVNSNSGVATTVPVELRIGRADYLTEEFSNGSFDLRNTTLTFTPDGSSNFYHVCRSAASKFPTDPTNGIKAPLGDDTYYPVTLAGNRRVSIFGTSSNTIQIGGNGNLTFDPVLVTNVFSGGLDAFFSAQRVAALYVDLNVLQGGNISYLELSDRLVVTYENVAEYFDAVADPNRVPNFNNAQIELFYDGRIQMTWLRVDATNAASCIAGLSRGNGRPADFAETDLSASETCGEGVVLLLPLSVREGDGDRSGTIILTAPVTNDLYVILTSSDPNEIIVEDLIIVPQGETSYWFPLNVVDDGEADGTQPVTITARFLDFPDRKPLTASTFVDDAQSSSVTLNVRSTGREGTILIGGGTVYSDVPAVRPLRVNLFCMNTNRVRVPSLVIIPAGQNFAKFDMVLPEDGLIQETQSVRVIASVANWTNDIDVIDVEDNESRELKLTLPAEVVEGQGALLNGGRITLSGVATTNIVVSLQSELSTLISVPASITINSGKSNALFTVTVLNNDVTNGFDSLRIFASSPGFLNTTGSIQVVDDERPSQAHTPTPQNFAVDVARDVTLEWLVNTSAPASTVYDVYLSTNANFAPLSPIASTTNHTATLPRHLNPETTYYWKVVARLSPFPSIESDVWQFTTTPLLFAFNPIASPQFTGEPFPISVRALDKFGLPVTNYAGSLTLTNFAPVKGASTVVLTEVDTGPTRVIEMVNVSDRAINVAGWKIVLYDAQSWPEPVTVFTIPGPSLAPPGGLFSLRGLPLPPGSYPNFFFSTNILWSNNVEDNPVAVMLLDSLGNIADFICAFGADASQISNPTSVPSNQWSGAPAPANVDPALTLQRRGSRDSNSSNDWQIVRRSPNTNNIGFANQFTNTAPVAVSIQSPLAFVSGISTGVVTVLDPAQGLTFGVSENGVSPGVLRGALSNPIDVFARDDLAISLFAPDNVFIGEPFSFQVKVTNSGPGAAHAVTLLNGVSTNAALLSANSSQGSCALSNGMIVCSLGTMAADAIATIDILALGNERGTVTNFAEISRGEADGALGNNKASALTTVTLPQMAIFDVTNSEPGNTSLMNFSVRLSAVYSRTCSVAYATSGGTATSGVDFQSTAGVLVFPPGVTNLTVSVVLNGDLLSEFGETLFVTLSNPNNTEITRPIGTGTIADNDPLPQLSLFDTTVVESDGIAINATFILRLGNPSGRTVTVTYATANGSALSGLDYVERYGSIVFPPGTTNQTITVAILADTIPEPTKTFVVNLTGAGNAVPARGQAVGTIVDNDIADLDRFTFDVSPQSNHIAVPFTMTARDGNGAVANGFIGPVTLLASAAPRTVNIGTNSINWTLPLATSFHDARLQSIYLSNEVGGAGRILGLSLDIVTTPAQTLSNFTVRIRHTTLQRHLANIWESLGWVTVCQRDVQIVNTGWTHFAFSTPFPYNGRDNLMIDFSFDNSSFSSDGVCRSSATVENRSLFLRTDSAYGRPTNWPLDIGNNPAGSLISRVPNLRLRMDSGLSVSLIESNGFVSGVWSGAVRVPASDQNIILRAVDSQGHFGESAPFAAIPLRINKVSVSGNQVSIRVATLAGNSYVLEAGPSTSGPWSVVSAAIVGTGEMIQFNYVPTTTPQFYRVRAVP